MSERAGLIERTGIGLALAATLSGCSELPKPEARTTFPLPARPAVTVRVDRPRFELPKKVEVTGPISNLYQQLTEGHFSQVDVTEPEEALLAVGAVDPELDAHEYLRLQGFVRMQGDTHAHAYDKEGKKSGGPAQDDGRMDYHDLFREGTKRQDFLIYTGHGEQRTAEGDRRFRKEAERLQILGKLVGVSEEWTGTTETGSWKVWELEEFRKKNPGYAKSQGHVLIYGGKTRIGQMRLRGGVPDELAPFFSDLLELLPRLRDLPIGVFAHPSLYKIEETFDRDGQAPGYDPPRSPQEIAVMKGCELVSHSPFDTHRSSGLGDGVSLRSSNEACYRRLLRGGWRLSPYMGTDWHLPGYKAGPWTCVWARERTIDSVYDAMEERLTCGTEAEGVSIAFMGQLIEGFGTSYGPPTVMGQRLLIPNPRIEVSQVHLRATVRDRNGLSMKHKRLQQVRYVLVCTEPQYDQIITLKRTAQHVPDHNPDEDHFVWHPHRGYPGMARPDFIKPGEVVAVYTVADLVTAAGKRQQLISAPLFVEHRNP